ncbi:DHA2 family efflux MFS transporter permease subunit [Tardiphaga sp. P9-11]|nr:MFS transporter [Tardiphaga sp. P9-11]KAA0069985.1 DHA2 family efflux MFS transporter permease subunit [Tardiphaga sp. P9-11]
MTGEGRDRTFLLLLCVSVPSFMINLDGNIVAVSLPSIVQTLNADFASIEWVISAYTLTFAALIMPAGALADRFGRKRVLIIGLSLFTLASLLCGASPNVTILNAARAAQGVGAALLLSAALALLSKEFQGASRAPAFAFWGSVIGIAMTLGPLAGGVITQTLGWEWAFYVNVPVGVLMIGLSIYAVDESRDPDSATIDIAGSTTLALALFMLTFVLISGNHRGWTDGLLIGSLAASLAFFVSFVVVEAKQRRPMLDLRFFRQPIYIGANIAGLAYAASLLTMLTYIPLYFQGGMGASPISAGLLMLPLAMPLFVVPRIVARHFSHWVSGRTLLTVGLVMVSVGLLTLACLAPSFNVPMIMVGMAVAGTGAGILNGETARVGLSVIPPNRAGMAAGVGGTVRFAGVVIGFAGLGAILYQRIASELSQSTLVDQASLKLASEAIASGYLTVAGRSYGLPANVVLGSFTAGYQMLFAAAGLVAAGGALGSWVLVTPTVQDSRIPEVIPEYE